MAGVVAVVVGNASRCCPQNGSAVDDKADGAEAGGVASAADVAAADGVVGEAADSALTKVFASAVVDAASADVDAGVAVVGAASAVVDAEAAVDARAS